MPGIKPLPLIPGVEITGIIEKVGNHVTALNEGDKDQAQSSNNNNANSQSQEQKTEIYICNDGGCTKQ